jgi:hypothetical protein
MSNVGFAKEVTRENTTLDAAGVVAFGPTLHAPECHKDTPQKWLRGIVNLITACNVRNAHVQSLDEESADSSMDDRSNYDFCNILAILDLHGHRTLERFYSNPIRCRNTGNDTNVLPKGATTTHSKKRGLHRRQEQRKHQEGRVALPSLVVGLRWAAEEQLRLLLPPLLLMAQELITSKQIPMLPTVLTSSYSLPF